jgi:hypothetical protein
MLLGTLQPLFAVELANGVGAEFEEVLDAILVVSVRRILSVAPPSPTDKRTG